MTETSKATITIPDLTKMLGLPESDQSAVAAWCGPEIEPFTQAVADELVRLWKADSARIAREA